MRRFYKTVSVISKGVGFAVQLDGKPLKTPAQKMLLLPNRELAEAVAAEWEAQGNSIIPATMPLMQLAATALDHVPQNRVTMKERLLAYVGSDVLCHRVSEPPELKARQEALWNPPLLWLAQRYDIHLNTTMGLTPAVQPESAQARLAKVLDVLDDWQLIGVQTAALAAGSLVLALTLFEGVMSAEDVFAAAELETTHQLESWGEDEELIAKREAIRVELLHTARWFALLRS